VDFSGTVALNNCSGSLVRFEDALGSDKALVLTNGHCNEGGFITPGKALANVASTRAFKVLDKAGQSLGQVKAERILYATMTDTDVTVYRLTQSYDEIEALYATSALLLSSRHPEAGRAIVIASGYWKKLYSCEIDGFAFLLKEAGWTWKDSVRYTQPGCDLIGGTSGSPVIDAETREVVAIHNTGNDDGEECTMNNPCEVDENGQVTFAKGESYGQETYILASCFERSALNLAKPGCLLPKP
jgi:V8-like Glu-specific endopeptidase